VSFSISSSRNADCLELKVNLEKSSIVIFRNGGHIGRSEKWFFKGEQICVVNQYKYLGVWFSTRLSFSHTVEHQTRKAIAGSMAVLRTLWQVGDLSPQLLFKMFDTQIKPILLYGSEIWGLQNNTLLEKAHLFVLKKCLNVSLKTPNDLVYGETGRKPLAIDAMVAVLRYWLRLTRIESSRLPRKAYDMQLVMSNHGKRCWAKAVENILMVNGFGHVWLNQGAQYTRWFLRVFYQCLSDCWQQDWFSRIRDSDRYNYYRIFKCTFGLEPYFTDVKNRKLRNCLIRFRLGISDLKTHKYRYVKDHTTDLSCPFCAGVVDEENHFLFECTRLSELRNKHLISKYRQALEKHDLQKLMNNFCEHVARYIYYGFKLRKLV
jgi:hypothetical protein